jgi:ATP/maltotriose-dependent transcriptional regulator MalT
MAYNRVDEGAEYLKKSLAVRATLGDRTALGMSQMHFAQVDLARNRLREAEKSAVEAQANLTAAGDAGRDGLLATLLTLSFVRCSLNRCAEGLRDAEQAMEMARMVYLNNSLPWAWADGARLCPVEDGRQRSGGEGDARGDSDHQGTKRAGVVESAQRDDGVPQVSAGDAQEG